MAEINIIKIDGKPIEKLISTVSSAIGTLYKPRAMRNEADAEAYKIEKLEEAKSKGLILKAEAEFEILARAKERFINQELNRQLNIENIAEKAAKYLKESVSEQPVDDDWRTKFFNKSQDISNDDMQEVWAKILAEEVSAPGRTSIRTLEIVSNLSKSEAELFQKLCGMTVTHSQILKFKGKNDFMDYNISFDNLLTLKAAGLLHESDMLNVTFSTIPQFKGTVLLFSNIPIQLTHPTKDKFTFDSFALTKSATELCRILPTTPNMEYINAIMEEKKKDGYDFKILIPQSPKPTDNAS
jgi:hypothetical protein